MELPEEPKVKLESGLAEAPTKEAASLTRPAMVKGFAFKGGQESPVRLKKNPDAPKRFKSAFIFFSSAKHKEIKKELDAKGEKKHTTEVAKMVSEAWRSLRPEERAPWEEKSRLDKERYELEKSVFDGPWKVPAGQRAAKDASAPKRPSSAFLSYSNKLRAGLKRNHPQWSNAQLSKELSHMWKTLDMRDKKVFLDEEVEARKKYHEEMAIWRTNKAQEKAKEREEHYAAAILASQRQKESDPPEPPSLAPAPPNATFSPSLMQHSQQQYLLHHLIHQQQPPPPPPPHFYGGAFPPMSPPHASPFFGGRGLSYPPGYELAKEENEKDV